MKKAWVWLAVGGGLLALWLASRTRPVQTLVTQAESTVSDFFGYLKGLISRYEGLSLTPYQDQAGKWTIGYGHLIVSSDPYAPYGSVTSITQDEADALLTQDSQTASDCVTNNVTVQLSDAQRAALVSFVFNVGCGAFTSSTLLAKLNAGDYAGAAAEFANWNHITVGGQLVASTGLTTRRASEASLFTTGVA